MVTYNRRRFVQTAVAGFGAAGAILGANDRVNVAVIGLGGRGADHVRFLSGQPNCRIAAVCDVNQEAQERGAALVNKAQGHTPKSYNDMRKLFADKEVDAVTVAAPNHWHALTAIWAIQAGKDVYLEKPGCHNVFEGRKVVEAAAKYKRMVQLGSQSRSTGHKIRAMKLLQEGVIGKLYQAKGLCFKRRRSIGVTPVEPVPAGIDWDIFLGPAPMRPFTRNRYKYNWHWFWDTGNGDIGNQGIHEMDMAMWGLGKTELPKSVVSTGGKYVYEDDQETPNTQLARFDFGDCELIFEVRGLLTEGEGPIPRRGGNFVGNLYYGADGLMAVDSEGFQVYKGEKLEKVMEEGKGERASYDAGGHFGNFLEAVRTRDRKFLTAKAEVVTVSSSLCHIANISYRLGRKLEVTPSAWKFSGDEEANRMLTREYRAPYTVPEKV